jgi:hypothetical protein
VTKRTGVIKGLPMPMKLPARPGYLQVLVRDEYPDGSGALYWQYIPKPKRKVSR